MNKAYTNKKTDALARLIEPASINGWDEKLTQHFHKTYRRFVSASSTLLTKSDKQIAELTKGIISDRDSKGYRNEEFKPDFLKYMVLRQSLGAEFCNCMDEVIGITGAYEIGAEGVCPRLLHAQISQLNHALTIAFQDGRLDHIENEAIRDQMSALITLGARFIYNGRPN